jgi:hypothetical protein
LDWKYIDSLPEIQSDYDDSQWPDANLAKTYDDKVQPLLTPVSLLGSDYGFNTGVLVFRGHFTANGDETSLFLETQGGSAFGTSVWINSDFVGSFVGYDAASNGNKTYSLPNLKAGSRNVILILLDQMGMDENYVVGENEMKNPRGILRYKLSGHDDSDVTWKLTGNLGGEDYLDKVRGPLNEGGLWAERQGYHLPGSPISDWKSSNGPTEESRPPESGFTLLSWIWTCHLAGMYLCLSHSQTLRMPTHKATLPLLIGCSCMSTGTSSESMFTILVRRTRTLCHKVFGIIRGRITLPLRYGAWKQMVRRSMASN